jgi:hypothetical protein
MRPFFKRVKKSGLNPNGVLSEGLHNLALQVFKKVRVPTKRRRRGAVGRKTGTAVVSRFLLVNFFLEFFASLGWLLKKGQSPTVVFQKATDYDASYSGKV